MVCVLLDFFKICIHFIFKDLYYLHILFFSYISAMLEYPGSAVVEQLGSNGDTALAVIMF